MRKNRSYAPARAEIGLAILFSVALPLTLASALAGCSQKPSASSETPSITASNTASPDAAKRYKLTGKILSMDKSQKFAQIDGQDIPGFMGAMTMNYPVIDVSQLDKIGPGDEITADVVVTSDGYHLENIVVTKKGSGAPPAPPSSNLHVPQRGDAVPDFALTNQDGKRIHLSSFRGDVLLVTFIYTKCPFPDYCPLISKNFANIYAEAKSNPALSAKMRLLTVSFDPTHDTPAVLRHYGASFQAITKGNPFSRWEFATASPKELEKMSDFFGVSYEDHQGILVHSMSTSVITPEGTIYKWYDDNTWKPNDLMKDASEALLEDNGSSTATQAHLRTTPPPSSAQAN